MTSRVQVKDILSEQILFECDISDIEKAYQKAREFEEMGLDIKVVAPGLTETLISSLGANQEEIEKYKLGLEAEVDDHNNEFIKEFGDEFGCAICPPKKYS